MKQRRGREDEGRKIKKGKEKGIGRKMKRREVRGKVRKMRGRKKERKKSNRKEK